MGLGLPRWPGATGRARLLPGSAVGSEGSLAAPRERRAGGGCAGRRSSDTSPRLSWRSPAPAAPPVGPHQAPWTSCAGTKCRAEQGGSGTRYFRGGKTTYPEFLEPWGAWGKEQSRGRARSLFPAFCCVLHPPASPCMGVNPSPRLLMHQDGTEMPPMQWQLHPCVNRTLLFVCYHTPPIPDKPCFPCRCLNKA